MLSKFIFTTTIYALCAYAVPASDPMIVQHSRSAPPAGIVSEGPAPASSMLDMRIVLTSSNMAGLEEALFDVSTPGSANFRQFLTEDQVNSFVAPTAETISSANSFLEAHGLQSTPLTKAGEWITVSMPVSTANQLFDTSFETFTEVATGQQGIRTLSFSLPSSLIGVIETVHPTTSFDFGGSESPEFHAIQIKKRSENALPASCDTEMTPSCLQELYGIPTTPATQKTNTIAVSGFIEEFAQTADLKQFLQQFRPDLPDTNTFTTVTLDDGKNPQGKDDAGIEANLDTQYAVGIGSSVPVTFFSVGETNKDGIDGFMDIVTSIEAQSPIPNVWTTSYGFNEDALEPGIATSVCNSYMKLGARGTSIFFSSGDGGVGGSQPTSCTLFLATFPSTCPFVTSVGATTGFSPETAANFSSGGFSNFFAQPSYQTTAVEAFIKTLPAATLKLINATGRAFPDVSAQGTNIPIVFETETGTVAGTSCSTPITAAITALLNDQLVAAGKPPVGFVNPLFYSSNGAGHTDITSGDNPGCNTTGFEATVGWDAITGWGTPVFSELQTLFGI